MVSEKLKVKTYTKYYMLYIRFIMDIYNKYLFMYMFVTDVSEFYENDLFLLTSFFTSRGTRSRPSKNLTRRLV